MSEGNGNGGRPRMPSIDEVPEQIEIDRRLEALAIQAAALRGDAESVARRSRDVEERLERLRRMVAAARRIGGEADG